MDARMLKASWLVDIAFTGIERPYPIAESSLAVRAFKLYHRLHYVRRFTVFFLLWISYIEIPFWCGRVSCGDISDAMTPLTFDVILLSRTNARIAEVCCLCFIVMNDMLLLVALRRQYLARIDRLVILVFSTLSLLNAIIFQLFEIMITAKIALFLRLVIFCTSYQSVRSIYFKMYKVLAKVQHIISLVVVHVCFFGWLATILFQDTAEGLTMSSYLESSWQMLILLTTANFPDVMMPAYSNSRWQAFFFIIFLCFGLFFAMNLILAQIFTNFQTITALEAQTLKNNRTRMLNDAFELLCDIPKRGCSESPHFLQEEHYFTPTSAESDDLWIEESTCEQLLLELNNYRASPRTNGIGRLHILEELNSTNQGRIYCDDFVKICDIMLKDHHGLVPSEIQRLCPCIARSWCYTKCCRIVQHGWFDLFVDIALFSMPISAISSETWSKWNIVDISFSSIYLFEMIAKVLVYGTVEYWYHTKNRFDAIITIATWFIDIYAYIPNSFNDHTLSKALLTARCLRVLRLIMNFEYYRAIFLTWVRLLPIGKDLLLVLFCNMNFFASLGHSLFGGLISPGRMQTSFPNSTYTTSGYAVNNFNDIPSGMVTLFELLLVNNWFVIAEGHVLVTSAAARLFFIAFWLIGVILTLNLFIASILVNSNHKLVVLTNFRMHF
ncbi:two pore calcium channel protein 1 [Thraustotheca clavata]|uniref:Two pore calcium channel protein 1 n=1 Tax=Thraustotheca clavata TaxID=74557 RepID=A0A1W0AAI5_9STRA|nr:two pore calcium channel protein 1 [Thraustotheca clavata]